MKQVLQHPAIGEIVYEESFWTGKKALAFNGAPLTKVTKNSFRTENGEAVNLTGNFLTGTNLVFGTETIGLTPRVQWYEIVLSILPFLFIMVWGNIVSLVEILPVVSGAIGGAISAVLSLVNLFIIKDIKQIWLKVLISIAVLGVTIAICYGIGAAILSAVK